MQGASIFHLARGPAPARVLHHARDPRRGLEAGLLPLVGVEDPEHVADARASALSFIAGHTVAELEALGEEIFDESMAHRIWPGTRALAQLHLDQGQRVWLVTAAPIEIATIIARRLGLTGALGTVAEHVDGVYTGRLVGEMLHGSAKAVAVRALAERLGPRPGRAARRTPTPTTTCRCSARSATRARSTPTRALREHARAHGWRIRDYRTGRKAARAGMFTAAVAGAAAGTVAAGAAIRRKVT